MDKAFLKVERLKEIKENREKLYEEEKAIISELQDIEIYQNEDGTWTRFKKIDVIKELEQNGKYLDIGYVSRYFPKIEVLKNKPKELGGE